MKFVRQHISKILIALSIGAGASSGAFALGMNNAPCDGFMDCVYTAAWWTFWR